MTGSLRSLLDKSGKGIEERGKRKLKNVFSVTKHGFVF